MPRKLFFFLVFLLAASTALAWPGRKKKVPPPTEELSTPAALRFLWPPSRDNFVNLVALILFVWIVVLHSLRVKKTAADAQHEERRLQQVLDQLAQVSVEHKEVTEKRAAYFERKAKLQALAAEAAGGDEAKAADEFKRLLVETGFGGEELTAALPPARYLGALVDDTEDLPLDHVTAVTSLLGE